MNSFFTLGLIVGISIHETTLGTTVANLGLEDVRFPSPLFVGDTVHVETEVIAKRESRVAADERNPHARAPRLQPARRADRDLPARRADVAGSPRRARERQAEVVQKERAPQAGLILESHELLEPNG